tara:strand:+ start:259 stop:450 length:192 start_codon:yes stop_codon:yes gene_type:complete
MKFEDISLEIGDLVTKEAMYGGKIYYGIVIDVSWDWRGPTQTIFHEQGYSTQSRRSLIYWQKI